MQLERFVRGLGRRHYRWKRFIYVFRIVDRQIQRKRIGKTTSGSAPIVYRYHQFRTSKTTRCHSLCLWNRRSIRLLQRVSTKSKRLQLRRFVISCLSLCVETTGKVETSANSMYEKRTYQRNSIGARYVSANDVASSTDFIAWQRATNHSILNDPLSP